MEEIWKDIDGFEGCYQVSNFGNVRSVDRYVRQKLGSKKLVKGVLLKTRHDKDGYAVVSIKKDKKCYLRKIHRLVAIAFIPNDEKKPCIDHIDGSRDNNIVSNLRWCTVKENNNFPMASKRRSDAVRRSYINNDKLRDIRAKTFGRSGMKPIVVYKDGEFVGKFECLADFCRIHGYCQSNVRKSLLKSGKSHGYDIKYI